MSDAQGMLTLVPCCEAAHNRHSMSMGDSQPHMCRIVHVQVAVQARIADSVQQIEMLKQPPYACSQQTLVKREMKKVWG